MCVSWTPTQDIIPTGAANSMIPLSHPLKCLLCALIIVLRIYGCNSAEQPVGVATVFGLGLLSCLCCMIINCIISKGLTDVTARRRCHF